MAERVLCATTVVRTCVTEVYCSLHDTPSTVSPAAIGRVVVENDAILLGAPNFPPARIDAYRGTQGVKART